MKKTIFLFVINFTILSFAYCNNNTSDPYNLNFVFEAGNSRKWMSMGVTYWKVDSLEMKSGKFPVFLAQESMRESRQALRLNSGLYQTIELPDAENKIATFNICNKCVHLDKAWLKVVCLDNKESVVHVDSVDINNNMEWLDKKMEVPLENIRLLRIEILALGVKDREQKQKLLLDGMKILIDGKDINSFGSSEQIIVADIDNKQIIPLSFENQDLYQLIPALKEKRIIALGESFHGGNEINKTAFQIMKNRVLYDNCRLILFELPLSLLLKWNLYIQEEVAFTYEEFLDDFSSTVISPESLFDLLNWLKQYNGEHKNNRVHIAGVDNMNTRNENIMISDYFYHFRQKENSPELDTLSYYTMEGMYKEANALVKRKPFVRSQIGETFDFFLSMIDREKSKMIIERFHEENAKGILSKNSVFSIRDYLMWINAQRAIEATLKENEKVTLYAHWGHANILNATTPTPETTSLGWYMKKAFRDDYFCIGLLAGTGARISLGNGRGLVEDSLESPPPNSIESLCLQTGYNYFYTTIDSLYPDILRQRFMGGKVTTTDQFNRFNLKQRMDAFIFIKKEQPPKIPLEWKEPAKLEKFNMHRLYESLDRNKELRRSGLKNKKAKELPTHNE